jgi:hypothetical protein
MKPPATFDSAAMRADYERAYRSVTESLQVDSAASLLDRFLDLEARLDPGMIEVKTTLMISSLLTTDEDNALGAWIFRQHSNLARLGRCIVEMAAYAAGFDRGRVMRALAVTFLHWGEAVKWELMVGRTQQRDHALLHGLMRIALDLGEARRVEALVVDGISRRACIEALYFRTLILDRFTSGTLSRQEIEVLDAWLWKWSAWLVSDPEAELVWRADLDSDTGLRYGRRRGEGPSLYLPLAPLEAQRQAVVAQFHRGFLVPATGRAADMRLEAHVAVLLQLRATFAGSGAREVRHHVQPREIEVWVGLAHVTRVLQTDERLAQQPGAVEPQAVPGADSAAAAKDMFDQVYDLPRRMLVMRDASFTGYLLEAPLAQAADLNLHELVALRPEPEQPPLLARIARRVYDPEAATVSIGVHLLCDPALQPQTATLRSAAGVDETYIFVPGADGSGRRDGFLVTYRALEPHEPHTVRAGDRSYTLTFNRVRERGRGWALAGFEINGAG